MKEILFCAAMASFGLAANARADEIKAFVTIALTDQLRAAAPQFEQATGHKLLAIYEPQVKIIERIKNGEAVDLVILLKQPAEDLKAQGRLDAATFTDFGKTRMALAVKKGASAPDISTPDAFKKTMLAAKSVASSETGASGDHFIGVLKRLGILEEMTPKLRLVKGSGRTGDLIVSGEAEMAVQTISELTPVQGIDIVAPFPHELRFEIVISGAMSSNAEHRAATIGLIDYLKSPTARAIFKKLGMEAPG